MITGCVVGFLAFLVVTTGQTTPYKLTPDQVDDTNVYKLQCKDSNGILVPNALFFRNGVLNSTDDCFSQLNKSGQGYIQILLTSECDGQYLCGIVFNNGYILSGPTEVLVAPTVNDTSMPDIVTEEGQDVLIKCPFSESPFEQYYTITLQENKAGSIIIKTTLKTGRPNNLILTNATQADSGTYFCQLTDMNSANVYNGPGFKIQVNAKFSEPLINDIKYTTSDGQIQLSVIATGTPTLYYQWTVNDTLFNTTDDGNIAYDVFPEGVTTVQVRVSNTKYNGNIYSDEQIVVIADIHIATSNSAATGTTVIIILACICALLSLVVVVTSTIILILVKRINILMKRINILEKRRKISSSVLMVIVNNHPINFDIAKLSDNLPIFFIKLDSIISTMMDSINDSQYNPKLNERIAELQEVIVSWKKPEKPEPQVNGDQIPRGQAVDDYFDILLPSLNKLINKF